MEERPRPLVLVVDDDGHLRRLARFGLERAGFVVEEAGDAGSAIVLVADATRDYAAIVVDLGLPDRPGTDVVAHALNVRPGLAIVVCSGTLDRAFPPPIVMRPKPYLPTQLARCVQDAIDATRPR
jgi:CheY-like chemotaxis protein